MGQIWIIDYLPRVVSLVAGALEGGAANEWEGVKVSSQGELLNSPPLEPVSVLAENIFPAVATDWTSWINPKGYERFVFYYSNNGAVAVNGLEIELASGIAGGGIVRSNAQAAAMAAGTVLLRSYRWWNNLNTTIFDDFVCGSFRLGATTAGAATTLAVEVIGLRRGFVS